MAQQGLQVYRQLLRSAAHAFKGDVVMLTAARQEIRNKVEGARQVTDPSQVEQLISEGREAAEFLRHAIVQAAQNEQGRFEMTIEEEHTGAVAEPIREGEFTMPREKRKKKDKATTENK